MNIEKRKTNIKLTSFFEYRKTKNEYRTNFFFFNIEKQKSNTANLILFKSSLINFREQTILKQVILWKKKQKKKKKKNKKKKKKKKNVVIRSKKKNTTYNYVIPTPLILLTFS